MEYIKKYTSCNILKTTKLLDCALKGTCAVIRLNTVIRNAAEHKIMTKSFNFSTHLCLSPLMAQ